MTFRELIRECRNEGILAEHIHALWVLPLAMLTFALFWIGTPA